ncbi:MAG: class I SAM-dependent methyltransferase [Planctomycetes bacterium]|nr:class I SAM-dependent methyltransferase [Planctomycetota bacterium]
MELDQSADEGKYALDAIGDCELFTRWLFSQFEEYIDYDKVWEIGSGTGNISRYLLKSNELCLSDYEGQHLNILEERFQQESVKVAYVNLEDLKVDNFAPQQFNTILCINVLEHIKEDELALQRIAQTMSQESKFILLVPAIPFLYGTIDESVGHHRRYSKKDLVSKLEKAGLDIIDLKYFNRLSALAWFIKGRIIKQDGIKRKDMEMVDKILPILKAFEWPLPFGQSLIAVCRRAK